jgi:hypothetical protein
MRDQGWGIRDKLFARWVFDKAPVHVGASDI